MWECPVVELLAQASGCLPSYPTARKGFSVSQEVPESWATASRLPEIISVGYGAKGTKKKGGTRNERYSLGFVSKWIWSLQKYPLWARFRPEPRPDCKHVPSFASLLVFLASIGRGAAEASLQKFNNDDAWRNPAKAKAARGLLTVACQVADAHSPHSSLSAAVHAHYAAHRPDQTPS